MRRIYSLLIALVLPFALALVAWRGLRVRGYWSGGWARLGAGRTLPQPGTLWVHAVSVGEVQAAAPLVSLLQARHPGRALLLTTATPAGKERARQLFGGQVEIRYAPYDLGCLVRRALRRIRPALCVVMESELWPNLYHECARAQVPLLLASARLSERSARRLGRFPGLLRAALASHVSVAAQSSADAQRFAALGVPQQRILISGNIKFDRELPAHWQARGAQLRADYAGTRPVWVAGSTHPGEETLLLQAQRALQAGGLDPLLVIAPRHSKRFTEVATLLESGGWRYVRRSVGTTRADAEVLLLDTLGELMDFYAAADVAFVGGSLVPVGGHNLLEPAQLGLPVLAGPHQHNGPDSARWLREAGALVVVEDAAQVAAAVGGWLRDAPSRSRVGLAGSAAVAAHRGAALQIAGLVERLIERPASPAY
ncbi:MAG: lipid IV(A) 3-deoxy-D-manno-octulosonic acid transferase [Steroidobacteraceae bacterium]